MCGRRAAAARRGGRGPSRTAPRAAPAAPAFRRGSDPASQTFSPTATAPAATGVYDTASLTRQVWRSSSTTLPVRVAAYSTTQYYTSTVGCYATRACATPACANLLACAQGHVIAPNDASPNDKTRRQRTAAPALVFCWRVPWTSSVSRKQTPQPGSQTPRLALPA